jgi:hypothetical protein
MFKVFFNKKRQFLEVELWDVHPTTFYRWKAGRWGYFEATWDNPKSGKFGELHFVLGNLRFDTVSHEVFHVIVEYLHANRDNITTKNEEKYADLTDELNRKIVREVRKLYPEIRL